MNAVSAEHSPLGELLSMFINFLGIWVFTLYFSVLDTAAVR